MQDNALKHICVIGAGPSGITAAKNLLDAGLTVTVFEQAGEVGGNWVFSEAEGHSSVFETTHIISSKTLSSYEDYPMPEDYPDYPSHRQLAAYFQGYARHFNLYPHIRFHTRVKHCVPGDNGTWIVTSEKDGVETTSVFDGLAVCNGHHWNPRIPSYPGHFNGTFMHAHAVKRFDIFRDRRVLVIGGGNSACDVAVEGSRVAAAVDLSWRRGYWVAPKFIMGKPADVFSEKIRWMPHWLWQRVTATSLRMRNGRNSLYGLPEPEGPVGYHHPTINEDLFFTIRHGKIKPRPDIASLEGDTVRFTYGSEGTYDMIVACTGYIITHPFFDKSLIDYSEGEVRLWLKMFHPDFPTLFFIGLFQPLGCIWPGAELQSKLMAKALTGQWRRPDNVGALADAEIRRPDFRQINTPRHTITVNYHTFRERLLKQLRISR